MPMTAKCRTFSTIPPISRRKASFDLSSTGVTSSLPIMTLSAKQATITMLVAADRPPMKANTAKPWLPAASGRLTT
jgi:hypothetical protein